MDKVTKRSREELAAGVQQLQNMGFVMTGQWRRDLDSITQLDVLVRGPFYDAVFYARTLFDYQEIMGTQRMSEGVVQYKGAPLMLRLCHVPVRKSLAALLVHTTGPHELTRVMRRAARSRRLTLETYGLYEGASQVDPGDSEEFIFERLGFEYLEPAYRENWRRNLIPAMTGR